MIECQHSFDGKALFTVWLLMIVLGGSGCSSAVPPATPGTTCPKGSSFRCSWPASTC